MKNHAEQMREILSKKLKPNSLLVLKGAGLKARNADCDYPFRQDSQFLYLSGFNEPDAIMAIRTNEMGEPSTTLFCLPKDPQAEKWTGKRIGAEVAKASYGFDHAHDVSQLDTVMPGLLIGCKTLYYDFEDEDFEQQLKQWQKRAAKLPVNVPEGESARGLRQPLPSKRQDIRPKIDKMRLRKSSWEIEQIRAAVNISILGHQAIMQNASMAWFEGDLSAMFQHFVESNGAQAVAYGTIVASGENACILHYQDNNAPLKENELILVDAGAECNGYAADITRTFPKSGQFTAEQKAIYELVLKAQEAGIEQVQPQKSIADVDKAVTTTLVDGLIELGLIKENREECIKSGSYKRFYPHSFGHWMGLDVHDKGKYRSIKSGWTAFEPGMVTTVEPGIYIDPDDNTVDAKWRGIGVRIEDDILVTETGQEVLSGKLPKKVSEVEALMQKHPSAQIVNYFNSFGAMMDKFKHYPSGEENNQTNSKSPKKGAFS